jgi:hypothetical protein
MSPEAQILVINSILVVITYVILYPRFAGRDLNKLFVNDLIAMLIALFVAGSMFSNSRVEFSLLIFDTDWFWFCLLSYMLIETPFALRYLRKHRVFE